MNIVVEKDCKKRSLPYYFYLQSITKVEIYCLIKKIGKGIQVFEILGMALSKDSTP